MPFNRARTRLAGVILLATLAFAGHTQAQESKQIPFAIGQSAPSNTFLSIWMAQAAGLYQAEGLSAGIVPMTGGSEIGSALSSGRIQIMHIGMSSVVRANVAGAKLVTVASLSNVIRFTFFTSPKITTPSQLKGGVIGITSVGSESDATIGLALKKVGLTREDVSVKEVGGRRLPALLNSEITATLLSEPERSQAFTLGLNPMVDLLKDQTPWIFTGLVVDKAYLDANRQSVVRFLRATAEGNYIAMSDAERAKQVLAKELRLSDAKTIQLAYENFKAQTPRNIEPSRAGAENIVANVAPPTASQRYEDYVDETVWQSLAKEGLFQRLQEKYRIPPG